MAEPTNGVTLRDQGEFTDVDIDGVANGSLAIDHSTDPPRALVHTDGGDEPTHTIELPPADE